MSEMDWLSTYGRGYRRYGRDPDANFWVDPQGERHTKQARPYGYSEFYLWGGPKGKAEATSADYSDRLAQWDREKFNRCWKESASRRWDCMSSAQASHFLTLYYGRPIKATALAEGCNIGNGYPYWIVWWKDEATEAGREALRAEGGGKDVR